MNKETALKVGAILVAFGEGKTITFDGSRLIDNITLDVVTSHIDRYDILEKEDEPGENHNPDNIKLPAICQASYTEMYLKGFRFGTIQTNNDVIEITMIKGYDVATIICMNMQPEVYKAALEINMVPPAIIMIAPAQMLDLDSLSKGIKIVAKDFKNNIIEFEIEFVSLYGRLIVGSFKDDAEPKSYTPDELVKAFHEETKILSNLYMRQPVPSFI